MPERMVERAGMGVRLIMWMGKGLSSEGWIVWLCAMSAARRMAAAAIRGVRCVRRRAELGGAITRGGRRAWRRLKWRRRRLPRALREAVVKAAVKAAAAVAAKVEHGSAEEAEARHEADKARSLAAGLRTQLEDVIAVAGNSNNVQRRAEMARSLEAA